MEEIKCVIHDSINKINRWAQWNKSSLSGKGEGGGRQMKRLLSQRHTPTCQDCGERWKQCSPSPAPSPSVSLAAEPTQSQLESDGGKRSLNTSWALTNRPPPQNVGGCSHLENVKFSVTARVDCSSSYCMMLYRNQYARKYPALLCVIIVKLEADNTKLIFFILFSIFKVNSDSEKCHSQFSLSLSS